MSDKNKLFAGLGGLAVVIIVVLLIFTTADMPQFGSLLGYSGPPVSGEGAIAYMKVSGNNQGNIDGDVTESGREKMHAVFAIDHRIEIPRDNLTGLPTGQRLHRPFNVTTHLSPGAPKLYQMCAWGEQGTVIINYWRTNEKGQDEHYFTVKLENAIIVDITHNKPMVFLPENKPYGDMVTISFSYSKITWTHELEGVEKSDDWKQPK